MLNQLSERLTLPGMPEWTGLALLVILLGLGLCLLFMPFSVFGVKGRLDAIEAQLDELRAEIRGLAVRLSEGRSVREWSAPEETMLDAGPLRPEDPIAPRAHPTLPPRGRSEPRITWPKPR
ncbi:hypothetical protein [Sabulicella rubraurantiaca]|uniref:hypothetical protein n=1 Tax=Sabulicella rubraurantiaca TaxID=2811429 RepID=UPI001A95FCF1|nr:hypothetical protein [Sabulicella rubraurantiaca]